MSESKRMPAQNDVTGAYIETKASSPEYRAGWERIWGSKKQSNSCCECCDDCKSEVCECCGKED